MSPYRLLAHRAREARAPDARGVIARRDAKRSMLPLAAIFIAFFCPATRDCSNVVSPYDLCTQAFPWIIWLGPTYIGAAIVLGGVVWAVMHRRAPSGLAAIAAALASIASSAVIAVLMAKESALPTIGGLGAHVVAGVLVILGWRKRGWMRHFHFSNAWLVASGPIAILNALAGEFWGAWVFLAGYGTLLVVRGITIAAMVRAKCESESLARLAIRGPSLRV